METKIQECNSQNGRATQALRDCEAMRAKPCTNTRNLPDGRLAYKGCYTENDTKRALEPEIHVANFSGVCGSLIQTVPWKD